MKCELFVHDSVHKGGRKLEIVDGKMVLNDAADISEIAITSRVFSINPHMDDILGKGHRNLCGKYIEYDPIYGNRIVYRKKF